MTEIYEICVGHGYLGFGYYGERVLGIVCRPIILPDDYKRLGESVFFTKEEADANIPYIEKLVAECNHKRWDEQERRLVCRDASLAECASHSHAIW